MTVFPVTASCGKGRSYTNTEGSKELTADLPVLEAMEFVVLFVSKSTSILSYPLS